VCNLTRTITERLEQEAALLAAAAADRAAFQEFAAQLQVRLGRGVDRRHLQHRMRSTSEGLPSLIHVPSLCMTCVPPHQRFVGTPTPTRHTCN
jgi:hypothetical protein